MKEIEWTEKFHVKETQTQKQRDRRIVAAVKKKENREDRFIDIDTLKPKNKYL